MCQRKTDTIAKIVGSILINPIADMNGVGINWGIAQSAFAGVN